MADKLKLPVGIEDFREIRRKDFYYIDKTRLIEQLLDSWGKVNLFTRPRRFGKTLNMSMLRYFFENEATAIPLALDGGLRQPKVRYYCILMAWEHGKLKTGTNTYYNIKLQYQDI